jgi:hypothetical protein
MMKTAKKLIDLYADLALQRAEIEAQLKLLRPEVIALGEGEHDGKRHSLTVSCITRTSISVPIAKAVMTAAQLAEATVVSDITTITVGD